MTQEDKDLFSTREKENAKKRKENKIQMTQFPNKILLSQNRETRIINDYWVLQDFTDDITKEYVRLDKVCDWIKQQQDLLEDSFSDAGDFADLLKEAMEEQTYE